MSTYTDKIDSHAIHTNITNVQDLLNTINEMQDKTPIVVETIARMSMIVKNFSLSLENCNKNLISINWLEDASKALLNLKNYLNNFTLNNDVNSLINNSSNQLDILLQTSTKLNCVKSSQSLRGIVAAENEYINTMNIYSKQIFEKVKILEDQVTRLEEKIEEQDKQTQKNVSDFQNSLNVEKQRLDKFATLYQDQMATDKNTFSDIMSTFKESFWASQSERKETFSTELENIANQYDSIDKSAIEQRNKIQEINENLINDYKIKFDEYEQQVVNIVGIVNTNMFSHKYKEVADDAHNRAKSWHRLAVLLILAVGVFAIYAFVITVNVDTSWVKLVAKIFATTTLVTGAAYAARQASKQEKVERYARKIEMELVAIDPFIATLDDEKKSLIKEEIAKKIFGNTNAMEISSKDEAYTAMDKLTSIEEVIQSLITLISKSS